MSHMRAEALAEFLEQPIIGVLATLRRDGCPYSSCFFGPGGLVPMPHIVPYESEAYRNYVCVCRNEVATSLQPGGGL